MFFRFLLIALLLSFNATAKAPELIGEYGDWSAYFYKDTSGVVCYMASAPKKDEGKYDKRDEMYAVITHRPKDKSFDVINLVAGYTYKKDSDVQVKIGNKTYDKFFVDGDKAWAVSSDADKEVVEAMKKGERMIVHGVSSKGTKTKDTYSLKGFGNAYKAISGKCKK